MKKFKLFFIVIGMILLDTGFWLWDTLTFKKYEK